MYPLLHPVGCGADSLAVAVVSQLWLTCVLGGRPVLCIGLQQTTIPVSMPRIISDYVDSPFARSAPNTADQAGRPSSGRAGSRLSGPEGAPAGQQQ